jgi:oleate hydratase
MTAQFRIDSATSQVWLVGGVASMAAAVFLVRDAGVPAKHIHILK